MNILGVLSPMLEWATTLFNAVLFFAGLAMAVEMFALLLTPTCASSDAPGSWPQQLFLPFILKQLLSNLYEMLCWTVFYGGYFLQTAQLHGLSFHTIQDTHRRCQREYQAFLKFTPCSNAQAWTVFRRNVLLESFGRIDVRKPPKHNMGIGYLPLLPPRKGSRLIHMPGKLPRSLPDGSLSDVREWLRRSVESAAENNSHILRVGKDNELLAHCDCVTHPDFRKFGCEIAHVHAIDNSMCVVLHPDDIRAVIQADWGERHPLARSSLWWRLWFSLFGEYPPVSQYLTLIYPPRTHKEAETVMEVVEAGALFVADPRLVVSDEHHHCANHHPRPVRMRLAKDTIPSRKQNVW